MNTSANKPVIPREVADAIELLRSEPHPYSNEKIVDLAIEQPGKVRTGTSVIAIRSIPFDTLLAALVNGYEVEKSAEELAHDKIRYTFRRRQLLGAASVYGSYDRGHDDGYRSGIIFTLNTLGIKIPGINAKEDVK